MTEKAVIFNIQKFSLHDGPGIRTIVFLKGCPLRCKWCSNPESFKKNIEVVWDEKNCSECLDCVKKCPEGAIEHRNNKIVIETEKCSECLDCVKSCPNNALSVEGEEYSIEEIMKEVIKDKDFYDESGGGVTLSGGEVLMQPKFAKELLRELKNNNIHTAIETTGYATTSVFESVMDDVDLFLFDIKHHDEKAHIKWTGVSNRQILENLKLAVKKNKRIVVRIPVVPGVNDTLEDAQKFALLLKKIGIQEVELLPFHQFGESKYEKLGLPYEMKGIASLHREDLDQYREVFCSLGITCE